MLRAVEGPRLCRESFFSEQTPDHVVAACARRIQDESLRAFADMTFTAVTPSRVTTPVFVLGGEHDWIVTPAETHATARAYRAEAAILPGTGHNVMLDEPGWLLGATHIGTWLASLGI